MSGDAHGARELLEPYSKPTTPSVLINSKCSDPLPYLYEGTRSRLNWQKPRTSKEFRDFLALEDGGSAGLSAA